MMNPCLPNCGVVATENAAAARRIRWRGRLVWLPPTGNPYYVDRASAVDMRDDEIQTMLSEQPDWKDE